MDEDNLCAFTRFYPLGPRSHSGRAIRVPAYSGQFTNDLAEQVINEENVNNQNEFGNTPLHCAVYKKDLSLITKLIDLGANLNIKNNRGETPYLVAIETLAKEVATLLANKGANVDLKNCNNESPLHIAVCRGYDSLVEMVLNHGADPNVQDDEGNTPLHHAIRWGTDRKTELLLAHGAKVNLQNNDGQTVLHYALYFNRSAQMTNMLIDNKEDVNVVDVDGNTPLHYAARTNSGFVAKLLDNGAHVNVKNTKGQTPYVVAPEGHEAAHTISKHIIKLKLVGYVKDIDEDDIKFITDSETESECLQELEKMKATVIHENVSLYFVLSKRDSPYYLKNEEVQSGLEALFQSPDFTVQFPLYAKILLSTYTQTKLRFRLLTLAEQSLQNENRKDWLQNLPSTFSEDMFNHLSNHDLEQLIQSSERE